MKHLESTIEGGGLWIEDRPPRFGNFHHATPTFNTYISPQNFLLEDNLQLFPGLPTGKIQFEPAKESYFKDKFTTTIRLLHADLYLYQTKL